MNDGWVWRRTLLRGRAAAGLVVLAMAVSALLIGALVHGRWFMMDDPTILSWLRPDGKLHLADLPHIVKSSEIFMYGVDSRCRPVYWILRMAETVLWGDHTTLWFSARVVLFGATLAAFSWTLIAAIGPAFGALLMLYVTAQFYWGDVWAHASLGEQYAAVALGLFFVSSTVLHERRNARQWADGPLGLMSLATIIAVGSKENFAFLMVPLAVALIRAWRAGIIGRRAVAAVCGAAAFTTYVGVGVLLGLRHAGTDQYGNSGAMNHRLHLITGTIPIAIVIASVALAALAFAIRGTMRRGPATSLAEFDAMVGEQVLVALAVIVMVLVQFVYYDGQWPRFGGRYDFPGRLGEVIVAASAIVALRQLVAARVVARWVMPLASVALVAVVGQSVARHGFHVRTAARQYVAITGAMYDAIRSALGRYPGDSTVPIVLESRDPDDFEAAVWTAAVLPFYGGSNPVFLQPPSYDRPNNGLDSLFRRATAREMTRIALDGELTYRLRPFTEFPAALARSDGRCSSLLLREYEPMIPIPCAAGASQNAGTETRTRMGLSPKGF